MEVELVHLPKLFGCWAFRHDGLLCCVRVPAAQYYCFLQKSLHFRRIVVVIATMRCYVLVINKGERRWTLKSPRRRSPSSLTAPLPGHLIRPARSRFGFELASSSRRVKTLTISTAVASTARPCCLAGTHRSGSTFISPKSTQPLNQGKLK